MKNSEISSNSVGNSNGWKLLFLGSNWEALATLKALHNDPRFNVVAVITQPDKPVGRKKEIKPTEIKLFSQENDIPVYHTENKKERYMEIVEAHQPEIIVCKSFGEIIPSQFLNWPKYKSINVHFSLLPLYRGAVPIQAAILNGDKITGITIVQMVRKLDAGPVLKSYEEPIYPNDTNQTLRERLVKKSELILPDILEEWINNKITPFPQDESKATYCWEKEISKSSAQIIWEEKEAEQVDRMCRALLPWPVAWCLIGNERVKLFAVAVIKSEELSAELADLNPGEIKNISGRLIIGCANKDSAIEVLQLQPEGRTIMDAVQYLRGRKM